MKQGKILKVEQNTVFIGTEDSTIKKISLKKLDFAPNAGDLVEIYESDGLLYVLRKKSSNENGVSFGESNGNAGVQININNNNEQKSAGTSNNSEGKKRVNKAAYILIALFLGGIGLHKFYAGKIGLGVIYMLFCWTLIPVLVAFFEGIFAATQKADDDGYIYV